jgi:hypothetical protein
MENTQTAPETQPETHDAATAPRPRLDNQSQAARVIKVSPPQVWKLLRLGHARPATVVRYRAAVAGYDGAVAEMIRGLESWPSLMDVARRAGLTYSVLVRVLDDGCADAATIVALHHAVSDWHGPIVASVRELVAQAPPATWSSLARSCGVSRARVSQWVKQGRAPVEHHAKIKTWEILAGRESGLTGCAG